MYKLSDFYKFLYDNGYAYVCHDDIDNKLIAYRTRPCINSFNSYDADPDDPETLEIPYILDFAEIFGCQYNPVETKTIHEQLVERKLE